VKLTHYTKDDPPAWAHDTTDPIAALHGAEEGAWTYRTIKPGDIVLPEWRIVWQCPNRVLIKYTHWEYIYP
jgi:hypothetical protein